MLATHGESRWDMDRQKSIEWVTAYTAHHLPEAYVVAGRLKEAGIPHFIKPDTYGQLYGVSVGIHSEVQVYVDKGDFERAAEILEA